MKEIRKIIATYNSIDFTREKVALASVVKVEESSYRRIGARMLIRSNGMWIGGISGGCLEGDALKRSQRAIFKNKPSIVVYDTMEDDQNQIGVGLGCNGRIEVLINPINPDDKNNPVELLRKVVEANQTAIILKVIAAENDTSLLGKSLHLKGDLNELEFCGIDQTMLKEAVLEVQQKRKALILHTDQAITILIEFFKPETKLVIVGDNYDVNALVGIAHELGWEIHVIGKAKKLPKSVFNLARSVNDYNAIDSVSLHDYSAVLLMTHDYNRDKEMLPILLAKKPPYIGMLGPKKRLLKMQKDLPELDLTSITHLHSPVGLDIGAETPEEIALAIASEIVASFRNRKGTSLKFREGTIYLRE